ncbi:kinase-like protein [Exidia glandulosa HHB12029]|uniref:Kinase-like protein n=1 Tax=Exidia glandulosa HHB12029 TaxID=1314781 RepID=A0A165MXJ7_EXIGL|nr:kinase-like protein [Exidia glandulosa HHB12029]
MDLAAQQVATSLRQLLVHVHGIALGITATHHLFELPSSPDIRLLSLRPVKHGGFSDIYLGEWRTDDGPKKVALKVLRVLDLSNSEVMKRLHREISIWRRLSHPNVSTMCKVLEGWGPAPAMVSMWYSNGDVIQHLRRVEKMQCSSGFDINSYKLKLMIDVINGLSYLHGNSVVHADLKGANVLIADDGTARLCDFGLSVLLAEHSQSYTTQSQATFRGTPKSRISRLFSRFGSTNFL